MSHILSLETSTNICSIALHNNGHLIACEEIHLEKSHSEYLSLSIKNLLGSIDFKLKQLDAVAISKGPGSYTGLRIGTATAKGLCYALDIPLIAINTLTSMAHAVNQYNVHKACLCPMIDARRMEVYCLVADSQLNQLEPTQAKIIDSDAFKECLMTHEVIFFGNGASKCKEILSNSRNAIFIEGIYPSAKQIGVLAWMGYKANQFEEIAYFEPYYLKDFIAKKPSRNIFG